MSYALKQFTKESIAATRDAWKVFLDEHDMFDLEYLRAIDAAAGNMDYQQASDNEFVYGVFSEGTDVASGLVSVLHRRRPGPDVGWLKMMQVDLSPTLDEAHVTADISKFSEVIDVYVAAIVGAIDLQRVHPAKVLKLYGRNQHLLSILTAVAKGLAEHLPVAMDGRWLVIRHNK